MLQWAEQTLGDIFKKSNDRVETIFSVNPSYGFSRLLSGNPRKKYIRTECKFYERNGDVVNYDAGREAILNCILKVKR